MGSLSELKVGDEVVYSPHSFTAHRPEIATIEAITPKGYLKVRGSLFYPTGSCRGSGYYQPSISFLDDSKRSKIIEGERARKAATVFRNLSEKVVSFERVCKYLPADKLGPINEAMKALLEASK